MLAHLCQLQRYQNLNFDDFYDRPDEQITEWAFNTEYRIAEGKGKLGNHFNKFTFDLNED